MLLGSKGLFEVSHQMTADIVDLGPLLQDEDYTQQDETRRQDAQPAEETMRLTLVQLKQTICAHRQHVAKPYNVKDKEKVGKSYK